MMGNIAELRHVCECMYIHMMRMEEMSYMQIENGQRPEQINSLHKNAGWRSFVGWVEM